jgi:pimeloyl-ACP methyl ester carboxylesterase
MIEAFAEKRVNDVRVGVGSPLIMIHGLAASLHDWDDFIPAATEAGYASYAFDLLGHGGSYKPEDICDYNIEKVYGHMAAWIESLDLCEPPVLIAHSLGSYLALLYTLRAPEQVRALVLSNPFYDIRQLSPTMQIISRHQLLNTRLIESTPYWMFRALVDLSSLKFNLGGGASHSYLLSEDIRNQTALDYKRANAGIFNLPRTLSNLFPHLSAIKKRTLVVWGPHDRTLDPPSFSKLIEQLPNAHGKMIESCGHVPHQCHADEFNQVVLKFIKDTVS